MLAGIDEQALSACQPALGQEQRGSCDFRGIGASAQQVEPVGNLYLALGQGDLARDAFLKSLAIRERLASNEPDRSDFQRYLSVSVDRMGDLYLAYLRDPAGNKLCALHRM